MTRLSFKWSASFCSMVALAATFACSDDGGDGATTPAPGGTASTPAGNPTAPGAGTAAMTAPPMMPTPPATPPAMTNPAPVMTPGMPAMPQMTTPVQMPQPVETAPESTSPGMPPMMPADIPTAMPTATTTATATATATATETTPPEGTGMPPAAGPIVPMSSGSTYTLAIGDLTFSADGSTGRVTGLEFGGGNLLTGPDVNSTNYGSSFWTAPQDWDWPPAVDFANYTHMVDAMTNSIVFTSDAVTPSESSDDQWSVTKRFWGDAERGSVVLEYTIENLSAGAISVAPWEITRFLATGIIFYPVGDSQPAAQGRDSSPPAITSVNVADGIVWYDLTGADSEAKSVSDGSEGWLAYLIDGAVFIKTFPDIALADAAPEEAEVEIYTGPDDSYVELEQQGAYAQIAAGATSAPWQVQWYVRPVPADLDASAGSAALVDWVRSVIAE